MIKRFGKEVWPLLVVGLFFLSGCQPQPVGSKQNPLKILFVPYIEQKTIITYTDDLVHFLEKELSKSMLNREEGFHLKSAIPTSYVAVVEAFGTKRADVAAVTTFSYLLTKDMKKYPVEAFLTVERERDGRFYKGAIIARADSKNKRIEDLNGKRFAFSDPASTSGFILPSKLFKDKGIKLGETIFAGRHDTVVSMVYQKQVDAGAIYYSLPEYRVVNGKRQEFIRDARSMVETQIPDVENKVVIIGFTEDVPNEPWIIRTDIYSDPEQQLKLKLALQKAIIDYMGTPSGKELMQLLIRAEKLVPTTDSEYDGVRSMIKELDFDPSKFIK